MPFYDYACQSCGHKVEVMHGVNDTGPAACPRCGGEMRKLMSSVAIHFKGSGWAKKDARSASTSGATKSATDADANPRSAAATETPKSESAGDSKPAKSADAAAGDTATRDKRAKNKSSASET